MDQSTPCAKSFMELLSAQLENCVKPHPKFKPQAPKAHKRKYISLGETESESAKKSKLT